jgi:WD40 repeat protein
MFRAILVNLILVLCVCVAHAKQPILIGEMGTTDTMNENPGFIAEIEFNPDGKLIASTGDVLNQIFIWDVENRKVVSTYKGTNEILPSGILFHPKGDLLAFCNSKNNDIVFLNVKTNKVEKNRYQTCDWRICV